MSYFLELKMMTSMKNLPTYLPAAVLALVFFFVAVRRVGAVRLQIWQVMTAGASAVLLTGGITVRDAVRAVNLDVILFLFGMFVVGEALQRSGLLYHLAYRLFRKAHSTDLLVIMILIFGGAISALLMNDTMAIIGTPLVLYYARRYRIKARLLLLALMFGVTVGSVCSPIGNPQNLLIALGGRLRSPFVDFVRYLFLPTAINLSVTYGLLRLFYWREFHAAPLIHGREKLNDPDLARLCRLSLAVVVVMIGAKIVLVTFMVPFDFKLTYIAICAAVPLLLFSPERGVLLKRIDWQTLLFFVSMFILMQAVWNSGLLQKSLAALSADLGSIPVVLGLSVVVSQLVSNVPFTALYLPLLMNLASPLKALLALAAGSTLAGNLFILGAASNVIVIQNAEKEGETVTFMEFARIGLPLTVLNILVVLAFLN